jgi:hypothetical protein
VTEETALTLAQADMRLSKDGGAFAQKSAAGNATHDSDGWYSTTLSTTDTNTVGILKLNVHQPANMFPVWETFYVVEEAVYDAMYGAASAGPLQSTTAGRTLDVSVGGEAGLDWANIGSPTTAQNLSGTNIDVDQVVASVSGAVGSVTGAVGSVTASVTIDATSVDLIWDEAIAGHLTVGTTGRDLALAGGILVDTTITGVPTSTQLQLTAGSTVDDFYNDQKIHITSGTGVGQARIISDYAGATKTLTTDEAFITVPASGDGIVVISDHVHAVSQIADAVWDEPIEDHDTQGNMGWSMALAVYLGPDGPGIFIDSGAANVNTVVGTDGTEANPVSTFVAARTLADALGLKVYYLEGNSDITLAATHVDWEFIGIGSVADNTVNLGSQDVSRSLFRNLTIEGTQGGAGRITARDCALQDPGAGDTTLHIFAERCGFVDRIQVDTANDNVFDQCYSLVAGTAAPVIQATGASGTISVRHYSGGLEFETLSASHNVTWEGIGQVIFNVDCNVNANVSVRGIGAITDNTAGMASLTETSLVNMTKINAEADTAISDAALATAASLATVDSNVDAILVDTDTTIPALIAALNDISVADVLTTQMTEAYAADGTAPTIAQALMMIQQLLGEFSISGTTLTMKKLDGSSTAATFTLDDGTNPTSLTRAT